VHVGHGTSAERETVAARTKVAVMVSSNEGTRKSPLVSLIAGGTAGGIECAITYPFEFAKTRVQLRDEGTVRNPIVVIKEVIQKEGARALYKGCETLIAGTIFKDAIRFISFDTIKENFKDPETGTLSPLRNLMAGISSGVVASTFAVTPTERIKTALIDDARNEKRFRNPWHAIKLLVAENGLKAVYRGYVTTTMKQASTTAVRLGTYNILKDFEKVRNISQTPAVTFGNGAVAGTIVVFATQPFDTLKTRAQSVRGAGVIEAFNSIISDYGVKGLWRGGTMRLGRTVLAGGILFTTYEWIASILTPLMVRQAV
jgi:solute carrier family 25 (mitochondrial citrate transporter), member 1